MDLVKIDGVQTKIYLHKYANFYTFVYVLKNAFGDLVKVLDWDEYFPEIDRSVELNVFLGTEKQVREWLMNEKFCFTKLVDYEHKYFFVEKNDNKDFEKIINNNNLNENSKYKINIMTNIAPEIERFKKQEILDKIFKVGTCNLKEIDVKEEDILFNRDFVAPIKETFYKNNNEKNNNNDNNIKEITLYFYGTPLNDILYLAYEGEIKNLGLDLEKRETDLKEATYLCFMVNTGRIQPKHLALIRKLVELFRVCNCFTKEGGKISEKKFNQEFKKELDKYSLSFYISKEDLSNNDKKEKKLEFSFENNNFKLEFITKKSSPQSLFEFNEIVKSFKQSFNLRFLDEDKVEDILQKSASHNEIPVDYKFGCEVEDLEIDVFEKIEHLENDIVGVKKNVRNLRKINLKK